ncbi:histidinol-phosphate transaminase [Photobacterium galatheae]|uniref:Histidinol-phosphate aminotransferase n=2 Tax=Photobacterium galatheae TaxID=1654360 RepID=A0A066RL44_9GAMM|nr:histidinol-phosphate aminotransferase [Photobacterium galatheae]MCM0150128.1 histidinol-phosphate transaminase [Photobacterium galatheae]
MMSLATKLVPEVVKNLIPYQSARRIGGQGHIWLNANELEQSERYGESESYNRYPDFLPQLIEQAYLDYSGSDFLTGRALQCETLAVRGADEAIDLLIRTFCQPGEDQIVICPPTYAMYEFCADSIALKTVKVPLTDDFGLDVAAVKPHLKNSKILFLCSPNNPTGNVIPQEDIVTLLEAGKASTLVVVDEAYIEFAPQTSVAHLIADYPNLVVIRTLSKAFGLASIRVGFVLADKSVMDYVARLIPPYPIADPSALIAQKALQEEGLAAMRRQANTLIAIRDGFVEAVSALPFVAQVYPSSTNFVLVRFKTDDCLYDYLLQKGIVTRNQSHDPRLARCVRISIGTQASMAETLQALKDYPFDPKKITTV